jgi:SagB-type dehydrogenase family enzyme
MLAVEGIYLLSRIGPLTSGQGVTRYDLRDWGMRQLKFPRVPGCPACLPLDESPVPPELTERSAHAIAYEHAVRFPSRHLLDPKGHQVHYRPSNMELAKEGKAYPSAAKIALPEFQLPRLSVDTVATMTRDPREQELLQPVTLERLTTLLALTAGLRPGDTPGAVRRWSPTGGNLGSVELYMAAIDVAGLDAGLYFYQARDHALAHLYRSKRRDAVLRFVQDVTPPKVGASPNVMIVMTGAHLRVARKYLSFAYRVINLDAGVALTQMQLVGRSLGLDVRRAPHWDEDRLCAGLDLDDPNEVVTAVVHVCGARHDAPGRSV